MSILRQSYSFYIRDKSRLYASGISSEGEVWYLRQDFRKGQAYATVSSQSIAANQFPSRHRHPGDDRHSRSADSAHRTRFTYRGLVHSTPDALRVHHQSPALHRTHPRYQRLVSAQRGSTHLPTIFLAHHWLSVSAWSRSRLLLRPLLFYISEPRCHFAHQSPGIGRGSSCRRASRLQMRP